MNTHILCCVQDTVETLLRHSADVNARDKNWQTPLHVAAANNAVKCAEYLIPLLANVNISDRSGRTALHHAAFNGHVEVNGAHLGKNIAVFNVYHSTSCHGRLVATPRVEWRRM